MQEKATIQTKYPGFRRRLAAMVYESLLIFAVLMIAGFAYIPLFGSTEEPLRKAVFQLYLMVVLMIYFLVFWIHGGQTLAMKTWRIRLVDLNGARISLAQGMVRFSLAVLGLTCFGLGFLWALIDPEHQFLHDRLAKTRLIITD